ncbi:MAG: DUF4445 domain-containing protein [Betaproteobacteria bacterium]|nr:MAG: DUF4445 domain-containing protein [Betaproteobacteria bacterium]
MPPLPVARALRLGEAMNAPPLAHPVRFANLGREAACRPGETLFQCARRAGIRIVGACGGRGVCGTCLVRVVSGDYELLGEAHADGWLRACKLVPLGPCTVELAPRSTAAIARAEVGGRAAAFVFDTAVRVHDLTLTPPQLSDPQADADRLLARLGTSTIDVALLRELPVLLRKHGWRVRAVTRGDEVIALSSPGARVLGLAVDLGTTNAAGFLVDLQTGERLGTLGIENPQASYGADVVSRVNHAIRSSSGGPELQAAAAVGIAELARDLCEAAQASTGDIAEIAVCGNTAMHHLLAGLPVAQLGRAPFVPTVTFSVEFKSRELGLPGTPGAVTYLLPNIGGFVGGDHVAVLLATEARWTGRTALVIDIGTNTEVSLISSHGISTVSCPSGPALEGGHISCGMRAAEGAIERVHARAGRLEIKTIGDAPPVGVCGSGVVDAIAAFRALELIDRGGRIAGGAREIALAPGVAFTQHDVRAVQLAKAAIRAGIDLLLETNKIQPDAIELVLIAGAFGEYLGIEAALAIGLLPRLPLERIEQVGNAAGIGVAMALASLGSRARAVELAARCHYLELGTLPQFQKTFIRRIGFD